MLGPAMARHYPGRLLAALGLAFAALALLPSASGVSADSPIPTPAYRNPALTVDERVADLLSRMTLEEKVGQLMMWDARSEDLSFINTRQPGSILHILGAKVDRAMDLAARNRLGIPLLRLLALIKERASIARTLAALGEATEVPRRSQGRGPPYWKSRILRRQALGDEEQCGSHGDGADGVA